MESANIGELIRARRLALGLTLKEMQLRTGIDNGNLSKIERGITSLTNDSMKVLAKALNVSLPELFTDPRNAPEIERNISDFSSERKICRVNEFENLSLIPQDANVAIGTLLVRPDAQRGGVACVVDVANACVFFGGDIRQINASPENLVAIEIEDGMMEPRLFATDTVVVDLGDKEIPTASGVFAVILDGTRVSVCRLAPLPGKGIRVMYDSPAYANLGFAMNAQQAASITIVGRVKHHRGNAGL